MVSQGKWKLMLVDFGFARALETDEIAAQTKKLRNSIVFERESIATRGNAAMANAIAAAAAAVAEEDEGSEVGSDDLDRVVQMAAASMKHTSFEPMNELEDQIMGSKARKRNSGISMPLPFKDKGPARRVSTARHKVRSMSALGTKAYAAPEIRKKLRQKTDEDYEKTNAAMTECVADYGMIVDAYSVGWTLRVAMTGVPPNFTLSEYMKERDSVVLEGEEEEVVETCCCMKGEFRPFVKVREPSMLPYEATLLVTTMTEKTPENRMTVREAQLHPWIAGKENEERYFLPQGDIPSGHGDPVVPLDCAPHLSKLTVQYHMA
jgi:serine/threonine protein kinase